MLFLSLACIALGGVIMTKINEERDLYAPKSYMTVLASRPKNVYAY